jgi:glycolate oxidase FAD binding subunit
MAVHRPTTIEALCEVVRTAAADGRMLAIRGGGSKAAIGAPTGGADTLDMTAFSGLIDYAPADLVLVAGAGTPLAKVETLVADHGQMLAFEPVDPAPLFGEARGRATIGGIIAAGLSGPRRLSAGGARDHLLGFEAVSGRGEAMSGGARVVKNVTGYDLPKLVAGSWGRLVALTSVTLKTLPRPRATATLAIEGLGPEQAQAAMDAAMATHAEIAAAAHLAARPGEPARTLFRLAGFDPSVEARCTLLPALLNDHGAVVRLEAAQADALWSEVRDVTPLANDRPLWRILLPPSHGGGVALGLDERGADWLIDWAGGLVWACHNDAEMVRTLAHAVGGHATLIRGPEAMRARTPCLDPPAAGVARLAERVRRAFDPAGVFETGRFLDHPHAD